MTLVEGERKARPPDGRATVAVIGAGYVGLPTAAVLAHFGHRVVCVDNDPSRIEMLRRGEVPIVESGLEALIHEGVGRGLLRFTSDVAGSVAGASYVFLCVPTPQRDDGSADTSFIESAARQIGPHLSPDAVIVNKSTVPVGTVGFVENLIGRSDVAVVSNPEFLRESSAVHDSLHPDRIVVGADDRDAAARVGALFSGTGAPMIVTDTTTAETIKYASNAFLATKLSFVNAIASLCEAVGADVRDVTLGLGYDRRIGFEFLRPGPGWGGSCLPKDTAALVHLAERAGYDFTLLRGAIAANDEQLQRVVDKVIQAAGGSVRDRVVGVLGLTFKAGTDDRRYSPAVAVARDLLERGAVVRAFDPTVDPPNVGTGLGTRAHSADMGDLRGMDVCADPYDVARGSIALAVLTEWREFRHLDFDKIRELMDCPVIVDARNLFDPAALRRLGFRYTGIGRP